MNTKNLTIIALLAVAVSTVAWMLNKPAGNAEPAAQLLFPSLADSINEVTSISMKNADGKEVVLMQKDGTWRVQQKSRYFADSGKVRALMLALSSAKTVETKTANPEYYSRLGVSDIDNAESEAVLLQLNGVEPPLTLLVGNSATRAGGSSFVRKPQDAQSFLVAPELKAKVDIKSWLDTNVIDIDANEIQSVTVTQAEQEAVGIAKDARFGGTFTLAPPIDDRTVATQGASTLSRALTAFKFDDVRKAAALPINDMEKMDLTFVLFDGVVIDVSILTKPSEEPVDVEHWLVLSARFDEGIAQQFVPQPSATEETPSDEQAQNLTLTVADIEDRKKRTATIADRARGWAYKISSSRYNSFAQTKETLGVSSQ